MRKSDKKIENQIREVLTDVCEDKLKSYEGFVWVTHTVNYSSYPQSLKIICVFETSQDRANFLTGEGQHHVATAIQKAFHKAGTQLKNVEKQISYETKSEFEESKSRLVGHLRLYITSFNIKPLVYV